ncbi:unannotated protein [freshwater metagenome]|uniref:Unannotated protein n=1 Tax=freshwater metagenome TaxID=449393 RepID=A0A6J7E6N4_9ZZZZ
MSPGWADDAPSPLAALVDAAAKIEWYGVLLQLSAVPEVGSVESVEALPSQYRPPMNTLPLDTWSIEKFRS